MSSQDVTFTPFMLGETSAEGARIGGQWWIRASHVATAFGYTNESSLRSTIKRKSDLLGPRHAMTVPIPTDGGIQQTRVFSFAGVLRLAMLISTPKAREIALQIVEEYEMGRQLRPQYPSLAEPGTYPISADALRAFNAVKSEIEPDHPAQRTISAMMIGSLPLPPDPLMDAAVEDYIEGARLTAIGRRKQAEARKRVSYFHYSDDALRAEVRRRERAQVAAPLQQASLTFDPGEEA